MSQVFSPKKAVVIHSGGMDSSLCLSLAIREFGVENVVSLTFLWYQRHAQELQQAEKICQDWGVDHVLIEVPTLQEVTVNALLDRYRDQKIIHPKGEPPNTLVVGRNGLMARLGAIYAHQRGAHNIYMGVIELDESNAGYRDCSRAYMDLKQQILRIDLDDAAFEIRTPLVMMTKKETLELAESLGILDYLLQETITCYEGIPQVGCRTCPACVLRNQGIREFVSAHPQASLPYMV